MARHVYTREDLTCLRCGKWMARATAEKRHFNCPCGGWIVSQSRRRGRHNVSNLILKR